MPEPGVDTENEYANSKFSKRMLNTPTMRQQANERERERGGEGERERYKDKSI